MPSLTLGHKGPALNAATTGASSTGVGLTVGGLVDSNQHTCGHSNRSNQSQHNHHHHSTQQTPTNAIPLNHLVKRQDSDLFYTSSQYTGLGQKSDLLQRQSSMTGIGSGAEETTYFMNRDGCMETVTTEAVGTGYSTGNCVNTAAALGILGGGIPVATPGLQTSTGNNSGGNEGATNNNNNSTVISQQGIKNLVHDVQLKRQREIRDMMKKKREKAVLVDRISRWLFPTSFILLNIVYWALFGDHELW